MDLFTDISVYTLFLAYKVYAKLIVTPLAWLFLPLTKWYVTRKLKAIGLELNGKRPIDPQVKSDKAYVRLVTDWSLGYAEAWIEGEIEVKDTVEAGVTLIRSRKAKSLEHPLNVIFTWFNLQTPRKAWEVGTDHYDLGYDLWEPMFGEHMQYSCGYWKDAKNLKEAQEAKMDLIAKKLKLKPGMRILEIGCGWGGLARYVAKNYGVSVVGYTVSKEQKKYADNLCTGLPVEIRLADYRTINEKFDAVVSCEMFEHVGEKNYRKYFEVANRALKDDGLFLLQTMGISHHTTPHNVLFIHKHIFMNGYFPHHSEICKHIEELFILEDWHNMGHHYYLTYKAWYENLEKAWPKLEQTYGAKFRRIWTFYLMMFMAGWKSRGFQSWQIVFSKNGLMGGYDSVR